MERPRPNLEGRTVSRPHKTSPRALRLCQPQGPLSVRRFKDLPLYPKDVLPTYRIADLMRCPETACQKDVLVTCRIADPTYSPATACQVDSLLG